VANICRIVKQITRSIDLNTLHALSRTCRQFRANLLQFRHFLVKQSLRCENDETLFEERKRKAALNGHGNGIGRLLPLPQAGAARYRYEFQSSEVRRLTSGKVGRCARDMVGECRKCGAVICRVSCPSPKLRDQKVNC
jgi:hypothetical protein